MVTSPSGGDVWRYDYLWHGQRERGETAGRKPRPVAVAAVFVEQNSRTNLFLLPITGTPPTAKQEALSVPQIERRRAGLDDKPLWIVLDEYNHDILEESHVFDPTARIGAFSPSFHKIMLRAFAKLARERRSTRVLRD